MSKEKIYETLYKVIGDCWEWAYDKPENTVAYFDGLWTMANNMIETISVEPESQNKCIEPF